MTTLNRKQLRTIGYSIARSALKIRPKDAPMREFINQYIATDKTAKKAEREADSRQDWEGFEEGVQEAINVHYKGEVESPIFTQEFKGRTPEMQKQILNERSGKVT